METVNPVLARKLGQVPSTPDVEVAESPASPMRQMRRALGRAADKAVGLTAAVLGIAEDESDAETLIEGGPDGWVVLGLRDDTSAGLSGLFLMDPALRSALVEMQTMGSLLPVVEDQRPVTRTDAIMSVPFASRLLAELAEVNFGNGGFDPASYDIGPMDDLRTAGLVMLQGQYKSWRITVQLGGEAQGEMLIALRPNVAPKAPERGDTSQWSDALRRAVGEAPAELDAVIATLTYPFYKIEEFEVGQVLNLAGTTVGSVRLTGPGGVGVASARLGQVAGRRAIRLEQTRIELQDDTPSIATASMNALPVHEPPTQAVQAHQQAAPDMGAQAAGGAAPDTG